MRSRNGRLLPLSHPLVLSLYVPSTIFSFCQGMLMPVLPLYANSFGASYELVGLVLAGEGIGLLLGDVPAGMLLERLGKRTMLIGVLAVALAALLLAGAGSIGAVLGLRMVSGLGGALYNVSRHTYMSNSVATGQRGRAIAIYGGTFRLGKFAGPVVGGLIAEAFGLRAVFVVFGAGCLVALVFVARFIESAQLVAHRATRTHHAGLILTLRAHRRILAVAGAGQVFALVIRTGTGVIIPLYAAEVLGLEVGQIGLIVSLASAMDLVLFYPAGLVMDRWGRKYAIVPSFLIQAGGMALLPFTGSPIGLLLAAGLISFGNGLGSGSMLTVGSDLAPAESRGEFLGLWSLIGDIGITGGPLAIGGIAGALSLGAAAWVIAGSGLGAALIFAFLVPETLVRPAPVRESASPLPQVEHQQG